MDQIGNVELKFSSLALHVVSLNLLLNYLSNIKITVQKCFLEYKTSHSRLIALTKIPERLEYFCSFSCSFMNNLQFALFEGMDGL